MDNLERHIKETSEAHRRRAAANSERKQSTWLAQQDHPTAMEQYERMRQRQRAAELSHRQHRVYVGRGFDGKSFDTSVGEWRVSDGSSSTVGGVGNSGGGGSFRRVQFKDTETTRCESIDKRRYRGPFWNRSWETEAVAYYLPEWNLTIPSSLYDEARERTELLSDTGE